MIAPRQRTKPRTRCTAAAALLAALLTGIATARAGTNDPAQDITLEQAIALALKQNRNLEAAALQCRSSLVAVDAADSEFRFVVSPRGSAHAMDDSSDAAVGLVLHRKTPLGTSVDVLGQAGVTKADGAPDVYRDTVAVELNQPLLRSIGTLVNRENTLLAESGVAAARRELELRKTDLVVSVAETHEALLTTQSDLQLQKRTLGRLDRLLRLTQAREKQGRATRADSLRAEIKLGDARMRLTMLEERLGSLRAEFAELLGYPPTTAFSPLPASIPSVATPPVDAAIQVALSNRLDYAQVLHDRRDAQRGVRVARQRMLPDLALVARYEQSGEGADTGEAASLDTDVWFVGLEGAADMPYYAGRHAAQRAAVNADIAAVKIESVRGAIARQVMQALAAHTRAQAEIALAEKNYQLARRRTEAARRLFERGRGDSFAASDAEDELQETQSKWLATRSAAAVSAYKLLRVTGTLLEAPAQLKPGAHLE